MAASGTISVTVSSVDYIGLLPSGTCYTDANRGSFGRGEVINTSTVNWVINDSNLLSFSYGSTAGPIWCICSFFGYHIDIQFSETGAEGTWQTIASSFANDWQECPGVGECSASWYGTVDKVTSALVGQLEPVVLTKSGYIRVYTWTSSACPTAELSNAYPTQTASQAVAVPVYIEVDYRPGAVRKSGVFTSTNNDGGACHILKSGTWTEMKTQDGGTGVDNPPSIRRSGAWVNQNKIGS